MKQTVNSWQGRSSGTCGVKREPRRPSRFTSHSQQTDFQVIAKSAPTAPDFPTPIATSRSPRKDCPTPFPQSNTPAHRLPTPSATEQHPQPALTDPISARRHPAVSLAAPSCYGATPPCNSDRDHFPEAAPLGKTSRPHFHGATPPCNSGRPPPPRGTTPLPDQPNPFVFYPAMPHLPPPNVRMQPWLIASSKSQTPAVAAVCDRRFSA